jgi:HemY protein
MIRVVVYLVIVALLAFGAAWFADRPGEVVVTWQGWRINTSVMVMVAAVAGVAVLAAMLWSLVRALLRSPDVLWLYLRTRRGVRGYLAVSQGLIAVGSGDIRAARKHMEEASRIAPDEPLTLLLSAQTAQLSGDRAAAERTFQLMAGRKDTRLLGLHGLYIEAQRRDDAMTARLFAEEAARHAPAPGWAGQAVLEFRCATGDWTGALDRLAHNMKSGLVDRKAYQRQRAVLLTAQALAVADSDRDRSKALALEAVKLDPTLVPAAAFAGRRLAEAGEQRKAARIIETAWRTNPHPDLAETYAHLRPGDSARERLVRVQALAEKSPGNIEGALAVARAALDAQEFAIARRTLSPLIVVPTRRVAMLMAELEEMEHGDEGRAREWMTRAVHARRDPAWTADGFVSERWQPVSPVTGRLDAFQWKDPLAGRDGSGAVIENVSARSEVIHPPGRKTASAGNAVNARSASDKPAAAQSPDVRETAAGREAPSAPGAAGEDSEFASGAARHHVAPARGADRAVAITPRLDKVIPLVHVPDDPGPEPEPPLDAAAEPPPEPASDGWQRLRQLFKP